jgi:RES domain-containing protein
LATLEVLTGLQSIAVAPAYVLIGVSFDEESVSALHAEDLPEGWNRFPPTPASQHLGDDWLATDRSAVLRVPSVIVPGEFNYLRNPAHPDFAAIEIHTPEELTLDPRLLP